MKKFISMAAIAACMSLGMVSCDDDDPEPQMIPVEISDGVFVLNSGNQSSKIDGTITYFDYTSGTPTQNVYQSANGKSLGVTLPGAVVYGSRIYIVGSVENTVFIADRKTMKEIATVKTEVDGVGVKGRGICAGEGKVFVASYNNTVFAIDTLTNKVCNTYASGSYSDGICYSKGFLYTGDTDYGRYGKDTQSVQSVSKIDLSTGKTTTITNSAFRNPTQVVSVAGRIFVQDKGYYGGPNGSQIEQNLFEINSDGSIKDLKCPASAICASNDKIYIIDFPYNGGVDPVYKVYDVKTGQVSKFCDGSEIKYPNMISVDPIANIVYISSYNLTDAGKANYKVNGYVVMYNALTGQYIGKFDCGVGPGAVIPNTHSGYIWM